MKPTHFINTDITVTPFKGMTLNDLYKKDGMEKMINMIAEAMLNFKIETIKICPKPTEEQFNS